MRRLLTLVSAHAQDGADARDDLAQRERLADVVVDPEIEPRDDILLGGERGQDDQPDGGRRSEPGEPPGSESKSEGVPACSNR